MKDFYIIIKILDFNSQKLKNFLNILKDILGKKLKRTIK